MKKPRVKIKLLGRFEILVEGNVVLEQLKQSKKTRQFLEYLILKGDRGATHEELVGTLWSEKYSTNPATALRTLLHRYRSMVEQAGIAELKNSVITSRGGYRWNTALNCELDINELERLCREAADGEPSPGERAACYDRIIELYDGPLLPDSAKESWAAPKSAHYHDLFMESMFDYIELLKTTEDHKRIVQVCRRALDVDMFDERLQMELTMALVKTGKSREALSEYSLMSEEMRAEPERLSTMYEAILQAEERLDTDTEDIRAYLDGQPTGEGAFVCDYDIFREVYHLQRCMLERYCSTMYLALVGISNAEGKLEPLTVSAIMKRLLDIMQANLRRGDVVSRYSATQYAVLLPSVTYETGNQVLERIKRSFYAESVNTAAVLTYKLRPLDIGAEGDKKDGPGRGKGEK